MKTAVIRLLTVFLCFYSMEFAAQNSNNFESLITKLQDINSDEIIYSVQIGAFKGKHEPGHFDAVTNLFSNAYDDGFTRFFTGLFKSINEAVIYRDGLRKKGYKDAFVLGLDGGFDRILIEVD